ncbi:MAG: hypothetical protein OXU29_10070, partial [Gammaproteobacteria bacterium]|nr:hypothetical protein [Gammaproteobacteria bacterium]
MSVAHRPRCHTRTPTRHARSLLSGRSRQQDSPLALDTASWYIPPNFNHRSATEDSVMNTA